MDAPTLYRQLQDYALWKQQLASCLAEFQSWFTAHRFGNSDMITGLREALETLQGSQYRLALVGEFSRGKTELINALLMSSHGQRLLPVKPGRSTLCVTELYCDTNSPRQCLRLLPVETRRQPGTLHNFLQQPEAWHSISIDSRDPASIAEAIHELGETRAVSAEEAQALGFNSQTLPAAGANLLLIPAWRHALINIDHPLLQLGLRIIDTPGLNGLGDDTVATLQQLAQADTVIFLNSADSGLGQRELQFWREQLNPLRSRGTNLLSVINKVDTLRDEPDTDSPVDTRLQQLRQQQSEQLQTQVDAVLPLSARQALVARQRQNPQTLQQSQWPLLDEAMATALQQHQQRYQHSGKLLSVVALMHSTCNLLQDSQQRATDEADALEQATEANRHKHHLEQLRERIREEQTEYDHQALRLRTHQNAIGRQQQGMLRQISALQLEEWLVTLQSQTHDGCSGKTVQAGLDQFFGALRQQMVQLQLSADQANESLRHIFEQSGLPLTDESLQPLDLHSQPQELDHLQAQANSFIRHLGPVVMVRRQPLAEFLRALTNACRERNQRMTEHLQRWLRDALSPLSTNTNQQKQQLDQQLLKLSEYQLTHHDQCQRLQQLQDNIRQNQQALSELKRMLTDIQQVLPAPTDIPTLTDTASDASSDSHSDTNSDKHIANNHNTIDANNDTESDTENDMDTQRDIQAIAALVSDPVSEPTTEAADESDTAKTT